MSGTALSLFNEPEIDRRRDICSFVLYRVVTHARRKTSLLLDNMESFGWTRRKLWSWLLIKVNCMFTCTIILEERADGLEIYFWRAGLLRGQVWRVFLDNPRTLQAIEGNDIFPPLSVGLLFTGTGWTLSCIHNCPEPHSSRTESPAIANEIQIITTELQSNLHANIRCFGHLHFSPTIFGFNNKYSSNFF